MVLKGVLSCSVLAQTCGSGITYLVNKNLLTTWRSFQPLYLAPVADHVLGEDFVPAVALVGIAS